MDWKGRFKKEYDELCSRIKRLDDILFRLSIGQLDFKPNCPEWMLRKQLDIMCEYRAILEARNHIEKIWEE